MDTAAGIASCHISSGQVRDQTDTTEAGFVYLSVEVPSGGQPM